MYSLTFDMMVQTLRQFGYTGEAHADIPARSVLKGGGRVVLIVQNGTITDHFIFNKSGQKLYDGTESVLILARLGILNWRLAPLSSPNIARDARSALSPQAARDARSALSPQAARPPEKSTFFTPRRLTVPQSQMRTWSTLHRSVYLLADGTHTIEQIAALLTRPPQIVEQAIQDLQMIGAINRP
jgi:hypothetical protein